MLEVRRQEQERIAQEEAERRRLVSIETTKTIMTVLKYLEE